MTLPPVEPGMAGMTRRNFLVEMNRRRVAQYEPTKKQLDDEDVRMATARQEEKKKQQQEWAQWRQKTKSGSTVAGAGAAGRALPGATVRSMQASGKAPPKENIYMLQKEEEAAKKREYNRLYDMEAKHQLEEREATLKKMRDDEAAQIAAVRELNAEQDRRLAEAQAQAQEEERQYMERLKESNRRELAAAKAKREAREAQDRQLQALVNENSRHRAEMDERRQKNVALMMKQQNEQFHKETLKKREAETDHAEIAALAERNRRLAKEEQEAALLKKETFKRDFEESIARDKEFRRTHNYDEPVEMTRQRYELAAQSNRIILEEERLRDAERKQQYRKDLMEQITAKQTYRMNHLDEPGM
ncbi:hypothetical protein ABL78_5336 [Leptomonas seymouri]|uniref:Trichohyalin-plectin-homology domain-containing protein n=1 Tax=Leptomonas seymouri TaxID=5684 RepID=A0A0N1PBM7_LEPSE|nr:hypothetical protein ABL78_5336 [Leptomonas seymouri]|eukprot:KPI85598.1 hypothetical protein ABL78_5336 [Leptomonas seymouri]